MSSPFLWLQQSEAPMAILVFQNCPSLPLRDPSKEHCKQWPVGVLWCVFEAGRVMGSALWSHHHHITTVWTLFSLPLAGIRFGHTNSYEMYLQNTPKTDGRDMKPGRFVSCRPLLPPLPLSFMLCFYFSFSVRTKTVQATCFSSTLFYHHLYNDIKINLGHFVNTVNWVILFNLITFIFDSGFYLVIAAQIKSETDLKTSEKLYCKRKCW